MSDTCNGCAEYMACDRIGRDAKTGCLAYKPGGIPIATNNGWQPISAAPKEREGIIY